MPIVVLFASTFFAGAAVVFGSGTPPPNSSSAAAVLNRYCITCHNEKLRTANLILSKMDLANVSRDAEAWEKVVRKLRTGAMPPAGMPRPDKAAYDSVASYLETELDRAAAANPNPGRTAIHRLNRAEYANAIRDLVAVEIDGEALLPNDESTYGFDNIGDVLDVSPVLLERYLSAARKISRMAIGDRSVKPAYETYQLPLLLNQDVRVSEDLPFGSRGGIAVNHYFPMDGEYVIQVRLQRNSRDYIRGLAEPHLLDVRVDGKRIQLLTVGGEHRAKSGPIYSQAAQTGEPAQEEYEHGADLDLNVRAQVNAGSHLVQVAFVEEANLAEGELLPPLTQFDVQYKGGNPAVYTVTVGGPFNAKGVGETPSRRKIFVCYPDSAAESNRPLRPASLQTSKTEEACARKILNKLAGHAYRRPVTERDLQTLIEFYRTGRSKGGFEAGIGRALERILVGPEFLFRMEKDPANAPPNQAYRISDLELATRLSFFLWSSIPDDELLSLAEQGRLKDPAVLERQVRRMLADSRAKALVVNFADQWLNVRSIDKVSPDPEEFFDFDENLRSAFRQETELFLESMLRENRSVMDLLNADYTYVNDRLAKHYGIPNVYGSHFRRVTVNDTSRRGLLGQGSILTVTSYATRTSPTLRGKWVLENIMGSPPPPPPPNVPSLKDRGDDGKILSVRQQMEQHRANPACAGCHARMDPLGFALENFDAVGRWRSTSGAANTPIDSSGVLPDGTRFQGPAELRNILMSMPEQFATTITEKLLTYALGRGVSYYDAPAIRKIVRESAADHYRWSSLILGVARSLPFQMRRTQEPATTATANLR